MKSKSQQLIEIHEKYHEKNYVLVVGCILCDDEMKLLEKLRNNA